MTPSGMAANIAVNTAGVQLTCAKNLQAFMLMRDLLQRVPRCCQYSAKAADDRFLTLL